MSWVAVGAAAVTVVGGAIVSSNSGGSGSSYDPTAQSQIDLANTQAKIGQEQWDRYKSLAFPIQDQVGKEVAGAGSPEDIARAEGEASADVSANYAGLRKIRGEEMRARGVGDPTSPHAMHEMNSIGIAEAGARSGATRDARNYAKDFGLAKRMDFLSGMSGTPGTALAGLGAASAGLASVRNANLNQEAFNYGVQRDNAAGFGSMAAPLVQKGADWLNTKYPAGKKETSGTFGSDWGTTWGKEQSAWKRGGLVKRYAEGGEVIEGEVMGKLVGPGTPTSDSIPAVIDGEQPAALSTDEFVLNADAAEILEENAPGFQDAMNMLGLMRRYSQEQAPAANEPVAGIKRGGKVGGLKRKEYA